MRMLLPAVATIALAGLCSQAGAQAPCPEFTRLRSEAVEVQKPMRRGLILSHCEASIRSSLAWRAVAEYADEHRTVCNISDRSVNDFEKYYREAVSLRDNVCAGRPAKPFPADIIRR